jgi:DNA-3-methyladenine glycosylase
MFGPAGHLYVYFTYGMHWCANVVCRPPGVAEAVLVRALLPVDGIESMRRARRPRSGAKPADRDLCRGPARLAQALGLTGADDGDDLCRPGRVAVLDDGVGPPAAPARGPRVGLTLAAERPWRWWVAGDGHVSAYRPGGGLVRRDRAPLGGGTGRRSAAGTPKGSENSGKGGNAPPGS